MPLNLGTESKEISIQKGPLIKIMSSLLNYKKQERKAYHIASAKEQDLFQLHIEADTITCYVLTCLNA